MNVSCFCVLDTVILKQVHILVYVVHSFMLLNQILQRSFSSHCLYRPELPSCFVVHKMCLCVHRRLWCESKCLHSHSVRAELGPNWPKEKAQVGQMD